MPPTVLRQRSSLFGIESNRFSSMDLGMLAKVLSTSLQNSSNVLQPFAATSASTHAHTFSIGLRSGEFPGQSFKRSTTPVPLSWFHATVSLWAAVWHGSLSCCSTNPCMPCTEKILLPSFKRVFFNTSLYSAFVMLRAVWPCKFVTSTSSLMCLSRDEAS